MPATSIATNIVKHLVEAGHIAYFAGGWVRDFLLKRPSDDIDIATSASVEQIQALFPKTIPVGVAFGIVIVAQDNHHFEVATFRKDRGYADGRRPTGIEPATQQEDAQRRDFTINGMFYDPLQEKLLDFVGGQEDLKKGVIKAIGDPHERFLEDRLRMMRAVRYSTRFNFPIEEATFQAILSHAKSLLPAVAIERIWQEFKKMSQFAHFDTGLIILHELDLLPTIFPALKQVPLSAIKERLKHVENFPKGSPPIAELLELFPDQSLENLLELCDYLKLSRQERDFVRFYHHASKMLEMPADWQKNLELIEWAHFYSNPLADICLKISASRLPEYKKKSFLMPHEERQQKLKKAIERLQCQNPVLRAEHLMKEGILPGKKMGQLLKEAERISVNEDVENPQSLIDKLKNSALWLS